MSSLVKYWPGSLDEKYAIPPRNPRWNFFLRGPLDRVFLGSVPFFSDYITSFIFWFHFYLPFDSIFVCFFDSLFISFQCSWKKYSWLGIRENGTKERQCHDAFEGRTGLGIFSVFSGIFLDFFGISRDFQGFMGIFFLKLYGIFSELFTPRISSGRTTEWIHIVGFGRLHLSMFTNLGDLSERAPRRGSSRQRRNGLLCRCCVRNIWSLWRY